MAEYLLPLSARHLHLKVLFTFQQKKPSAAEGSAASKGWRF
jgi:hypothetical protein